MQHIKIEKNENGFNVHLPYELKDSFKKALPSAKWNATAKCWTVGSRSLKKVEAWAETAEIVAEQIAHEKEAKDELEATEAEFSEAIAELKKIGEQTNKAKQYIEKTKSVLAEIANIKRQIEKAKIELQAERDNQDELSNKIDAVLDGIVDYAMINDAVATMQRMRRASINSKNREIFENAQSVIDKERAKLKKAGLGSHGLDDLYRVNWNRPDRDKIENCREITDIYTINS